MDTRSLAAVLCAALLIACAEDTDAPPRGADPDTSAVVATEERPTGVFVDRPAGDARLVFVGQDSTILPDDRSNAVFVPFSTFSVERDGIPNEFPPADSMAALLQDAGVGDDRVVIVGEPIPGARAFAAFDYLGLANRAALLDGGPAALEEPAREPGSEPGSGPGSPPGSEPGSEPAAGVDGTDVRDDMIVDAEWVRDRLDDPAVAILDARPPAEFSGETPGDGIDRPGHIPGARNVFWQTLVRSPDDPRLLDEEALRRIFDEAGVGPDDTVVSYCRTGGQASFLYAVARHLGYDVRLYDGSFIDWSRTDYPVER